MGLSSGLINSIMDEVLVMKTKNYTITIHSCTSKPTLPWDLQFQTLPGLVSRKHQLSPLIITIRCMANNRSYDSQTLFFLQSIYPLPH
jgi:hypothetical protein